MCDRDKLEVLRRIKAAGCPIEVNLPTLEPRLELNIEQTGEASLLDMGDGGTGLILWMRFAREKSGQITIAEFGDVILPWGALFAIWLDPLPESAAPVYRLPNGFDFPRDDVLNQRVGENGLCVRPGQLIEGFVLGSTKERIPEQYMHRSFVNAEFSVFDALRREFRGQVQFVVDRSAPALTRRHSARGGDGLYAPSERPRRTPITVDRPRDTPRLASTSATTAMASADCAQRKAPRDSGRSRDNQTIGTTAHINSGEPGRITVSGSPPAPDSSPGSPRRSRQPR